MPDRIEFYVLNIPFPKAAQFDTAYAHIYLKDDRIACCLNFVAAKEFENCMREKECLSALEKKSEWSEPLQLFYGLIADYFALEWDIEFIGTEAEDEKCELIYHLEGSFEIEQFTRIRTLLLEVREKERFEKGSQM